MSKSPAWAHGHSINEDWSVRTPVVLVPALVFAASPTVANVRRELTLLQAAAFDVPPVGSKPTHEKQHDEDDQDDADDTDAAVTEAVTVAAEAATEATEQEDDEDDDEYESERHDLSPVAAADRTSSLFAFRL